MKIKLLTMLKKYHKILAFVGGILIFQSCDNPTSIALHNPIYPSTSDNIEYSLEMQGDAGSSPKEVKLYEQITRLTVVRTGSWYSLGRTPLDEVLLKTWTNPAIGTLTYKKEETTPESCLIKYRFEVTQRDGKVFKHEVTYATENYPMPNDPIPVYVVGDESTTIDVVFIPDTDISNQINFRDHCRRNIKEAYFDETTTKNFRHSFNFYINPTTGHATNFWRIELDGQHQTPSNFSSLSFAEGKVIMHQDTLRDYAIPGLGLFSCDLGDRGTIMHESGHSLFGLADEYDGGSHWQDPLLPNNWSSLSSAQTEAPSRGKSSTDARQIGATGWYKICGSNCQMNVSGISHSVYDNPCTNRVINQLVTNVNH